MEKDAIETLIALFNKHYDTGSISERWLASTTHYKLASNTLPKQPNAKSCEDFRTISLMCHVLKIGQEKRTTKKHNSGSERD